MRTLICALLIQCALASAAYGQFLVSDTVGPITKSATWSATTGNIHVETVNMTASIAGWLPVSLVNYGDYSDKISQACSALFGRTHAKTTDPANVLPPAHAVYSVDINGFYWVLDYGARAGRASNWGTYSPRFADGSNWKSLPMGACGGFDAALHGISADDKWLREKQHWLIFNHVHDESGAMAKYLSKQGYYVQEWGALTSQPEFYFVNGSCIPNLDTSAPNIYTPVFDQSECDNNSKENFDLMRKPTRGSTYSYANRTNLMLVSGLQLDIYRNFFTPNLKYGVSNFYWERFAFLCWMVDKNGNLTDVPSDLLAGGNAALVVASKGVRLGYKVDVSWNP